MAASLEKKKALPARFSLLALLLLGAAVLSLSLGRYPISPPDVLKIMLSRLFTITPTWPQDAETVIFSIRLPRLIVGMLVGGGLSMAGASFQSIFSNPLVSPDVLGASSGAGFGAALAILLGIGQAGVSLMLKPP